MNKVSIKETYSINKKGIEIKVEADANKKINATNNLYTAAGLDNGILYRRGDHWNCYIDESSENIIIKPPAGLNHSYTDVIFHDFRIYGHEYTDDDSKKAIDIKTPLFLKCVQVPTLSRVVLKSHWNDYKSQYKLHLPRPFNVSDTLECYLANRIPDQKINLNDLINEIGKHSLEIKKNETKYVGITDITFDIEWISKTD